jgi:hypothetical protein
MKINIRIIKGLIGVLAGLSGPVIGFFIYFLFFGYYANSLTIIPFTVICSTITLIVLIILEKFIFKKIGQ